LWRSDVEITGKEEFLGLYERLGMVKEAISVYEGLKEAEDTVVRTK
jgi:hypothetical protein